MRTRVAIAILITVMLAGCDPEGGEEVMPFFAKKLTLPTNITGIDISAPDGRVLKRIDSSSDIARVLAFLTSHRSGWRPSNTGFPTPPLELLFYRGEQRVGRFGAGLYRANCRDASPGYFESDLPLNGQLPLHGIGASEADLSAFLSLVGMAGYSLETDDC